jgi:hypothetical protein
MFPRDCLTYAPCVVLLWDRSEKIFFRRVLRLPGCRAHETAIPLTNEIFLIRRLLPRKTQLRWSPVRWWSAGSQSAGFEQLVKHSRLKRKKTKMQKFQFENKQLKKFYVDTDWMDVNSLGQGGNFSQ